MPFGSRQTNAANSACRGGMVTTQHWLAGEAGIIRIQGEGSIEGAHDRLNDGGSFGP